MFNHASLCSGIGGFDLASEWKGWKNIFAVEIDSDCRKILNHHFPEIKIYEDVKQFNGEKYYGTIDVISAGFPCQPFSQAGKQRGKADDRYLWDEILRIVKEIKPTFFVGENVPGLFQMAQYESSPPVDSEGNPIGDEGDLYSTTGSGILGKEILEGLEEAGYQILSPLIIPACSINAIHRRDRIWILAYSENNRYRRRESQQCGIIRDREFLQGEQKGSSLGSKVARRSRIGDASDTFDNGSSRGSSIERGALGASEEGRMFESKGEDPWITGDSNFDEHRTDSGKNSEENQISGEHREKIILSGESSGTDSNASNSNFRGNGRYERQSSKKGSTTCSSESSSQGERRSRHKIRFPTSQPTVRRGDDGFSFVLDDGRLITPNQRKKSLEQLGNAIVPQVAYEIFSIIEKWYLTHGGQINANS